MDHRVILLVDDDRGICDAISDLLCDSGYQIITASNGRAALDALDAGPLPFLILLDLAMPVMDGYEFLRERAKDPRLASIPVAVLTAQPPSNPATLGLDVPIYRKPIGLSELNAVISAFC
jgi:CheY-like chemotaxis protein